MNRTVYEIWNDMNDEQQDLVYFMVGHTADTGKWYRFDEVQYDRTARDKQVFDAFTDEMVLLTSCMVNMAMVEHRERVEMNKNMNNRRKEVCCDE